MKKRKRISQCPNCQTMLSAKDNFCPNCGQENHYNDFSVKELTNDFFGSLINFDNKIWNTLKIILLQPGQITKQYIEGHRIKFVPPFKLYLFFSFIFFVILNLSFQKVSHSNLTQKFFTSFNKMSNSKMLTISKKEYARLKNANSGEIKLYIDSVFLHKEKWDNLKRNTFYNLANQNVFSGFRVDSINNNFNITTEKIKYSHIILLDEYPKFDTLSLMNRDITRQELRLIYENTEKTDSLITAKWGNVSSFEKLRINNFIQKLSIFSFGTVKQMTEFIDFQSEKYLSAISYSMLLMMPVISLLLFIFFRRKQKKIYVHLIHSIHLQVVVYIFTSILIGIFLWLGFSPLFWLMYFLLVVGMSVYFMISNKVLYQERKSITFLKSIILIFLYFTIFLFTVIYIGFISVAYM